MTTTAPKTIDHVECPFLTEWNSGKTVNVNGKDMPTAMWNLILSKRDLSMYIRTNNRLKPHRFWKITDVKKYFGISGNGQPLMDAFLRLYNQVVPQEKSEEGVSGL